MNFHRMLITQTAKEGVYHAFTTLPKYFKPAQISPPVPLDGGGNSAARSRSAPAGRPEVHRLRPVVRGHRLSPDRGHPGTPDGPVPIFRGGNRPLCPDSVLSVLPDPQFPPPCKAPVRRVSHRLGPGLRVHCELRDQLLPQALFRGQRPHDPQVLHRRTLHPVQLSGGSGVRRQGRPGRLVPL